MVPSPFSRRRSPPLQYPSFCFFLRWFPRPLQHAHIPRIPANSPSSLSPPLNFSSATCSSARRFVLVCVLPTFPSFPIYLALMRLQTKRAFESVYDVPPFSELMALVRVRPPFPSMFFFPARQSHGLHHVPPCLDPIPLLRSAIRRPLPVPLGLRETARQALSRHASAGLPPRVFKSFQISLFTHPQLGGRHLFFRRDGQSAFFFRFLLLRFPFVSLTSSLLLPLRFSFAALGARFFRSRPRNLRAASTSFRSRLPLPAAPGPRPATALRSSWSSPPSLTHLEPTGSLIFPMEHSQLLIPAQRLPPLLFFSRNGPQTQIFVPSPNPSSPPRPPAA